MVYSDYIKRRIVHHHSVGLGPSSIIQTLKEEGIVVSKAGVWGFLKKYRESGRIERSRGSGRTSLITEEIKSVVDAALEQDNETTAKILEERGHKISISTILRCRRKLGWTYRGSAYCQLIREGNKVNRLAWAHEYIHEAETGFNNVIYTLSSWKHIADTHVAVLASLHVPNLGKENKCYIAANMIIISPQTKTSHKSTHMGRY